MDERKKFMEDLKVDVTNKRIEEDIQTDRMIRMVNEHAAAKRREMQMASRNRNTNRQQTPQRLTASKGTAKRANEKNKENISSWKKKAIAVIMSGALIIGGAAAINDHSQRVHSAENITSISVLEDLGTTEETRDRLLEIRTDIEENENITMEQLEGYINEVENIKLTVIKEKIENTTNYDKSDIHIRVGDEDHGTRIMLGEKEYNNITGEYEYALFTEGVTIEVPGNSETSRFASQIAGMQITQERLQEEKNPYSMKDLKDALIRETNNTLEYMPVEVSINEKNRLEEHRMYIGELEDAEKEDLIELQNLAFADKDEGESR